MTKTYMEIFYPGSFFSETSEKLVTSRKVPTKCPKGAFGVRFFDREEMKKGGEVLFGKNKNYSAKYYWGTTYTPAQIKKEFPDQDILYSNVKNNGYKKAVRTVMGNWQPVEDKDVVIPA